MSTLDGPIWSKCSIALTCPARSHFQRTQNKENVARVGMNVTAHQENEETKKGKRGAEKRKRENRRLILRKLCVALLRSFRGQHSKKMKRSAQGNWDPREGQQSFRPNPNGVGNRTTTLRRLLIGAALLCSFNDLNKF